MFDINIINNFNDDISIENKSIQTLIEELLTEHKIPQGSVSIILSNKMLLNKLKMDYFGLNQFTDVITFNLEDENEPLEGEIYISIDDIIENAKIFEVSINEEFKRVLIHGVLHLIGFEDKNKILKDKMTKLENNYMSIFKYDIISYKNK
ncbi:MAG: rRNA maturation RNase YbeY [Candidatus Marinimicrobia bacterium]|nr:rRNA maturation RNase YbeY [Candidatus Neomarinimicrobiota bacterium]